MYDKSESTSQQLGFKNIEQRESSRNSEKYKCKQTKGPRPKGWVYLSWP